MCVGRNSNILSFFSSVLIVTSILNRGIAISGLDYIIYFLFIVYFLIETDYARRIVVPKRYFKVLIVLVLLYIINALFSEFSPSFPYVVLGSLFTILPFLHFVVNYNYNFSEEKISEYIDVLIKTILIIVAFVLMESVLFNPTKYVGSPIGSNIFMIGFFASLCNQGLILSISQYFRHKERKYIYCAAFLVCVIMLTFQIKAIVGMCLILAGYFFINFKNKVRAVLTIAVCFVLSAAVMWSIPAFQVKLLKYIRIYDITNEENNNIARIALYHTSFRIAEDYFPLGTGQGTYGSIPVNIVGSDVYAHYDIDEVYGISDKHDVDFKMDTHWSSVLGESGVLGSFLYLILMTFPMFECRKNRLGSYLSKPNMFILFFSTGVMMLESLVLALPNRFAFMFIYSGLSAIILRHEAEKVKSSTLK